MKQTNRKTTSLNKWRTHPGCVYYKSGGRGYSCVKNDSYVVERSEEAATDWIWRMTAYTHTHTHTHATPSYHDNEIIIIMLQKLIGLWYVDQEIN